MPSYNPTRNVDSQAPITFPRYLDQVPCPDGFERISCQTLGFQPYEAWVVASGQREGIRHLVVLITKHASMHYLVLVYATAETDWTYHDAAFFTQRNGSHPQAGPFDHLLRTAEAEQLVGMFFE